MLILFFADPQDSLVLIILLKEILKACPWKQFCLWCKVHLIMSSFFLLRQAATERAASAPEAASRGGGCCHILSTKGWKRYVHFIGFIVVFLGNLSFRLRLQKLSFCWQGHGHGASSHFNHFPTCDFAGRRSHRNLQWFLRTGPHAQGLKKGRGGIPATYCIQPIAYGPILVVTLLNFGFKTNREMVWHEVKLLRGWLQNTHRKYSNQSVNVTSTETYDI